MLPSSDSLPLLGQDQVVVVGVEADLVRVHDLDVLLYGKERPQSLHLPDERPACHGKTCQPHARLPYAP